MMVFKLSCLFISHHLLLTTLRIQALPATTTSNHNTVYADDDASGLAFLKNVLINGYDKIVYPNFHDAGKPTVITCSIYVKSFGSISAADMEFTMDVYMRQYWQDNRLAQQNYSRNFRIMEEEVIEMLWRPDTYFPNMKRGHLNEVTVPNMGMIIHPNGSVVYSARLTLTFSCQMNLRFFPFDKQLCYIDLGSYFHTEDHLLYEWATDSGSGVEFNDKIEMPRLKVVDVSTRTRQEHALAGVYSGLLAEITLERQFGYDLVQTYLPSLILVAISWVSCWLDVDAMPARTTLGVTTLLTITTQSSGARATLPPVSYIKAMDVWLGVCTFFVFGMLLEFTFVNYFSRKKPTKIRMGKAAKHDVASCTDNDEMWVDVALDRYLQPKSGKELTESQTQYIRDYVSKRHKHAVKSTALTTQKTFSYF